MQGEGEKNLPRFLKKLRRFSENLPRFLEKVQRFLRNVGLFAVNSPTIVLQGADLSVGTVGFSRPFLAFLGNFFWSANSSSISFNSLSPKCHSIFLTSKV